MSDTFIPTLDGVLKLIQGPQGVPGPPGPTGAMGPMGQTDYSWIPANNLTMARLKGLETSLETMTQIVSKLAEDNAEMRAILKLKGLARHELD